MVEKLDKSSESDVHVSKENTNNCTEKQKLLEYIFICYSLSLIMNMMGLRTATRLTKEDVVVDLVGL